MGPKFQIDVKNGVLLLISLRHVTSHSTGNLIANE